VQQICADLRAEHEALDDIVGGLDASGWDAPTPAEGWAVRDQISHLAFFDGTALLAATDPDAFAVHLASALDDLAAAIDEPVRRGREMAPEDLLAWWRGGRAALLDALVDLDPSARLPWYGPPMAARSFATARLMETWAHGQDVVDALGAHRPATDRLRHIAHIGVRTRGFSYAVRNLTAPEGDVRVELTPPGGGEPWTWGESPHDVVRGPALDFCLVVTQRRHLDDTSLDIDGPLARGWMEIAQAFAGPPGPGRKSTGAAP
jgi:uncharacterized protein (TIGR03084 family)